MFYQMILRNQWEITVHYLSLGNQPKTDNHLMVFYERMFHIILLRIFSKYQLIYMKLGLEI